MKDQVDDLRSQGHRRRLPQLQPTAPDESNRIFNAIGSRHAEVALHRSRAPDELARRALLEQPQDPSKSTWSPSMRPTCISSWGHDFRPRLHQAQGPVGAPISRPSPCWPSPPPPIRPPSATSSEQLGLENAALFENSFDRPEIHYAAKPRTDEVAQLLGLRRHSTPSESGIVYCLSRKRTQEMAEVHLQSGRIPGRHATTRDSPAKSAWSAKTSSSATKSTSSRPPSPLAWASTKPTCAMWCT